MIDLGILNDSLADNKESYSASTAMGYGWPEAEIKKGHGRLPEEILGYSWRLA